ncbi:uncharacterized protein HMPREF1541_09532 [Cyphellophora europaea CBS 101466]|uniref:RNA-binding protein n=1 Tax=Cyphellophora europaea (strain CBS 101466) TaxID=1220924 RepID=W2SCN8_CYPE1|nr:uncharacterized protein HMPREF1541_09532 [Cyphellophora europaea CBS 101466]ETN45699.1 hypothetical protein HMPREF1541_09532 [Cyphellophora europaea CBS 101466]
MSIALTTCESSEIDRPSRQFGFLRFPTLEEAQDFMDRHYPTIYLYGDSSKAQGDPDDSRVRLSYGKERRDTRPEDTDWICSSCNVNNYATRSKCFRCQTPKSDAAAVAKIANIGDNDASPDNTPSQFLLIRGLEASVSEEVFAKGIAKLNKPTGITGSSTSNPGKKGAKVASTTGDANLGAREGTLRRVLLVRDRRTNDSWRYGFAEYASIEDAQAAITRYNSFDRFTIASKHVLVSYIHAGVFVPVINPAPSVERFLFSPLNNPSLKLAYWDEDAYVTELVVFAPDSTETDLRTGQAKLADSEGLKSSSAKEKNNAAIRKRKAESSDPSTTKKPAPSHLQFWSNRHAELHGIKSSGSANGSEDGELSTSSTPLVATTQSFADPVRHCCYLCMRQFNDAAEVNAHERVSELHRANLRNKAKLQKALAKLSKHGVAIIPVETDGGEVASEYRDRAKERRKVYGVVNKKGKQVSASKSKPKSNASSSDAETPAPSKGAALLSKMGYTAGQGLGASGEGRKEVISQDVYAPGVGLGAQGGKMGDAVEAAERSTKGGFQDWLDQGRERARERYQGLE